MRWTVVSAASLIVKIRSLITASGFAHCFKCHSATAFSSQFRNLLHDVLRREGVLLLRLTEADLGARKRFAWSYGPGLLDTHYQRRRRVSPIWLQIQYLGAPCNVNVSCSGYPIMDFKCTTSERLYKSRSKVIKLAGSKGNVCTGDQSE